VGEPQSVYILAFLEETNRPALPCVSEKAITPDHGSHIEDLMTVYLKLVEVAMASGGDADWGREIGPPFIGIRNLDHVKVSPGYYFAASCEVCQLDFVRAAGKPLKAHGIVKSRELKSLPLEQVDGTMSAWGIPHIGTYIFAADVGMCPDRAMKVLDYEPSAPSLRGRREGESTSLFPDRGIKHIFFFA
jgi:hypothetical protein